MEIRVNEQVQRALQAKAAEGHFASVEEYVVALLRRVAEQAMPKPESELNQFHEELRQAGLLLSSKAPQVPVADEPFEPVTISGVPLSETIIAERR
jgi:Arc/MetJ-type ribon-helix-helix transcriptional regulator